MQETGESRHEGRWRSIIQSAVDGIILIDARGRIETFNQAAEGLFGYTEAEVLGRNVSMLMPQPYRDEHDGYLARYLSTGERRIIGIGREVSGLRKDGSTFPLHLSVGEADVGGERKFTGIVHDLTDRVQLEDRLRASEARWRSIVESAVDAIVVIDAKGQLEAFNPAAERLFGHAERDVIGQNVNILMPSPDHEEHDGYLARYLATGVRTIIGIGREVIGRRRDGTTFPVHLSVGEMSVNGERKFTGILHDLSARIEMEERLREQRAMARLGEMAAVIAHEVKNPLAGIRGAIQVIGGRLPADSKDAAVVKEIVNRIDALNEIRTPDRESIRDAGGNAGCDTRSRRVSGRCGREPHAAETPWRHDDVVRVRRGANPERAHRAVRRRRRDPRRRRRDHGCRYALAAEYHSRCGAEWAKLFAERANRDGSWKLTLAAYDLL